MLDRLNALRDWFLIRWDVFRDWLDFRFLEVAAGTAIVLIGLGALLIANLADSPNGGPQIFAQASPSASTTTVSTTSPGRAPDSAGAPASTTEPLQTPTKKEQQAARREARSSVGAAPFSFLFDPAPATPLAVPPSDTVPPPTTTTTTLPEPPTTTTTLPEPPTTTTTTRRHGDTP